MATLILDDCIGCVVCLPECPNSAIFEGEEIYFIKPELCTECVGFHDAEACAAVCPVDVCLPDPDREESEETLIARAKALHPSKNFGTDFPSHHRPASLDRKKS